MALDSSPILAAACAEGGLGPPTVLADAAAVPLQDGCADLVVAFMSPQDFDDLEAAVAEAARLLAPEGRFCMAIVHPLNSAGEFEGDRNNSDALFAIRGSYFETGRYRDNVERDGLSMVFHSLHRPLESYSRALEEAGFVIEAIREVTVEDPSDRWYRVPGFLHLRAKVG